MPGLTDTGEYPRFFNPRLVCMPLVSSFYNLVVDCNFRDLKNEPDSLLSELTLKAKGFV